MASRRSSAPTAHVPRPSGSSHQPVLAPSPSHIGSATSSHVNSHNAVFVRDFPPTAPDSLLSQMLSSCGPVHSISRYDLPGSTPTDAARRLNGNAIFGAPLVATTGHVSSTATLPAHGLPTPPVSPEHQRNKSASLSSSLRSQPGVLPKKNLYILNLPPDMTENELERAFSGYGTVNHVCILSTPDGSGRRRAFVDMLSGSAARIAASALDGSIVRSHRLEITFALVQRSSTTQGEYSPIFDSTVASSPEQSPSRRASVPASYFSASAPGEAFQPFSTTSSGFSVPPPPYAPRLSRTLLIKHLTPAVAIDTNDLFALFHPYGSLVKAQLVHAGNEQATGWGQVAFASPSEAEAARLALHGTVHGGVTISVERLDDRWLVKQSASDGPRRPRGRATTVGTMASTSTIDSPDNIAPSDSASCIGSRPEPSHPSQVASWAPYTVGAAPAPVPSVVTASQRGNRQSGGAIPLPPPSGDGAWPSMPVGGHPPVGLGLALDPAFEDVQLGPLTATPRLDNTAPRSLPATMSRFMAAHTPKAYIRHETDLALVDARLGQLALSTAQ